MRLLFCLWALTGLLGYAQQLNVTGNLLPSQVTGGTLAIGIIPTGTTSTTVALGNDSRFLNATSLSGTSITTLTGLLKLTSGTPSNAAAADIGALFGCSAGTPLLSYNGTTASCVASGSGTVTSFSAGDLSPLFTTTEATVTTTPALSFTLSTAAAHSFFGNNTGSTAAPAYVQPAFTDISGTIAATQLPNPSASTLGGIQSLASTTSKWINAISTAGVPAATQPAFTDISGTATVAQIPAFSRPVYLPAAGCNASTAFSAFDLPAANAPTAACYGTSYTFGTLDYADTANSTASFRFLLPTGFNSLDADVIWSVASATQTAKWTIATVCIASGSDVLNPTFNTVQTITSASAATANTLTTASQATVTVTGCSAGNEMIVKVGRDTTDSSTATISLRGVRLTPHITPQS